MRKGVYHLHRRKRLYKKLESYPAKNKWVRLLDKIVLLIAIIGPLFDLPQLIKIYVGKNASGVSLFTWFFFAFFAIPWFIYGIVHKEKPIIIAYLLWIIIDVCVVIGVVLYG